MNLTWKQFERYWYLFSLGVIIAALPFSKFFISFAQMMIAGGWIVERFDYMQWLRRMKGLDRGKRIAHAVPYGFYLLFRGIGSGFRDFFRNKPALLFSSVFLLHIAGLLFTTDFTYAFKDLRTKLPFLLLPLFLSTSRSITQKEFHRYMLLFFLALLIRTGFNTWLIFNDRFVDIREVSRNVSHIILALQIVLAIFVLAWFTGKGGLFNKWWKMLFFLLAAWLMAYLVISRSFTGIAITLLTALILLPFLIFNIRKKIVRISLLLIAMMVVGGVALSLRSVVKDFYRVDPVDPASLAPVTSRGNPYIHATYATESENGHLLWIYVQWEELREEWNRRSKVEFDSLDLKGHQVKHTLIRFLTSKGWRKDGDAVIRLTGREVTAIEKGVANYIFLEEFSIRGRIYEFLSGYEKYRQTGDPTGSTIMQRLEFWKASVGIIRDNWLTGVGTGDMNTAFALQYEKMHTLLAPDQRWRSHNQYLSILVGFGIFGLVWFLAALWLPPLKRRCLGDYFVLIILIITSLAMLTEDTIETQTGVTFVVLFYSLFLFVRNPGAEEDG